MSLFLVVFECLRARDRFISRLYSSITCGFYPNFNPTTFEGIKCTVRHFFLFKIKIFAFKMIRNWLLTFRSMNASTWLDRTGLCDWRLRVSWAFLLSSEIVSSSIAYISRYCLFVFVLTGMVIVECYLARHCVVNWSIQLEALTLREQLWSFDPCHYSLPLIQIVNKLITNSETRDDNTNRVKPTVKCETNHIK